MISKALHDLSCQPFSRIFVPQLLHQDHVAFNSLNGPSFSSLKAFARATSINQVAHTCACCTKSLQSCPTLCDPMDCSLPGSSVHGTLQARILEWVAMPSSRGSSRPRDRNRVSYVSCMGRQVLAVLLKCCEKQLYLVLSSAAIQGKFWQMSTFILQ